MANDRYSDKPEIPRVEPEIIPPDRGRGGYRDDWRSPQYRFSDRNATHRVYVGRIGPLGLALALFAAVVFAVVLLLILIGTALLWIPIAAAIVVAIALSRLLRRL